jgi:hypothetical protein
MGGAETPTKPPRIKPETSPTPPVRT